MLGRGEVIGELQMSWDELLNHGDEPFGKQLTSHIHTSTKHLIDLSFPPIRDVCPSLTLRAAILHDCDDQDCAMSDVSDAGFWFLVLLTECQP
jgi:hypothetical protein